MGFTYPPAARATASGLGCNRPVTAVRARRGEAKRARDETVTARTCARQGVQMGVRSKTTTLACWIAASALLVACRDEDVVDDAIFPDNVFATVERCDSSEARAVADVEVTNGTGNAAAYDVTVEFGSEGTVAGVETARSSDIEPGREGRVQVRLEAPASTVDDCVVRVVEEVSR